MSARGTNKQKIRTQILFEHYPDLQQAHFLTQSLKMSHKLQFHLTIAFSSKTTFLPLYIDNIAGAESLDPNSIK